MTGPGINCGFDCTQSYTHGTSVTLTASASAGSSFTGWYEACTGTGKCVVSMTQARSVTATFDVIPPDDHHDHDHFAFRRDRGGR